MSNSQPVPPVYRILIEHNSNWGDSEYLWTVTPWDDDTKVLWKCSTETGWGARRKAKRAVKKLRKGKTQPEPVTYPQEIYIYP